VGRWGGLWGGDMWRNGQWRRDKWRGDPCGRDMWQSPLAVDGELDGALLVGAGHAGDRGGLALEAPSTTGPHTHTRHHNIVRQLYQVCCCESAVAVFAMFAAVAAFDAQAAVPAATAVSVVVAVIVAMAVAAAAE